MYAVVKIGGHQYRVAKGDVLFVDKLGSETDQKITFDHVLLTNDGEGAVTIGKPIVEGASIEATLLDNVKADKVIVFKKKRRKGYRVKRGHRQPMSQIKIESISASGSKSKKTKKKDKSSSSAKKEARQLSTDMNAKEAIEHIRNTPLDDLQGFVPEDEERVTVLDAWESKQEG